MKLKRDTKRPSYWRARHDAINTAADLLNLVDDIADALRDDPDNWHTNDSGGVVAVIAQAVALLGKPVSPEDLRSIAAELIYSLSRDGFRADEPAEELMAPVGDA